MASITSQSALPNPMVTAPLAADPPAVLRDKFGRTITDLRVSITDRCNYKCVYCRTGNEGAQFAELAIEGLPPHHPRLRLSGYPEGAPHRRRAAAPHGLVDLVERTRRASSTAVEAPPIARSTSPSPPTAICSPAWPLPLRPPASTASPSAWTPSIPQPSPASPASPAASTEYSPASAPPKPPASAPSRSIASCCAASTTTRSRPSPLLPRRKRDRPLHRVHAPGRRPLVDARHGRASATRSSAAGRVRPPGPAAPQRTPAKQPAATPSTTALARSASSPLYPRPFAEPAAASGSPPTAKSAPASSRILTTIFMVCSPVAGPMTIWRPSLAKPSKPRKRATISASQAF